VIEVAGLVRVLGKKKEQKRVIDDLSFTAPADAITGLLGPNGAGKTTTMRILATLLRPSEGTARVGGYSVVDEPLAVRRCIGLVTEEPGLHDRLTPRELLLFAASACGLSSDKAEERLRHLSALVGLDAHLDTRCGRLSKGNRQKVSLVRALIHDPPVLLLDEPTANMDVLATDAFHELLLDPELRAGKTVLLSSHSIDEVDRLADRVVGIAAGRLALEGTRAEIAARDDAGDFRRAVVTILGQTVLAREPVL